MSEKLKEYKRALRNGQFHTARRIESEIIEEANSYGNWQKRDKIIETLTLLSF